MCVPRLVSLLGWLACFCHFYAPQREKGEEEVAAGRKGRRKGRGIRNNNKYRGKREKERGRIEERIDPTRSYLKKLETNTIDQNSKPTQ